MLGTLTALALDDRANKDARPPPTSCSIKKDHKLLTFRWGRNFFRVQMIDDQLRPHIRAAKANRLDIRLTMRIYCTPLGGVDARARRAQRGGLSHLLLLHEEVAPCWKDGSFFIREVLFTQSGSYTIEMVVDGADVDVAFAEPPLPIRFRCRVHIGDTNTQLLAAPAKLKLKRPRSEKERTEDAALTRRKKARESGKLCLSEPLLKCILSDWTRVVQNGETASLPCDESKSIDAILGRFKAHLALQQPKGGRRSPVSREDPEASLIVALPELLDEFLVTKILFHDAEGACADEADECTKYIKYVDKVMNDEQRRSRALSAALEGDALIGTVLWAPPQAALYSDPAGECEGKDDDGGAGKGVSVLLREAVPWEKVRVKGYDAAAEHPYAVETLWSDAASAVIGRVEHWDHADLLACRALAKAGGGTDAAATSAEGGADLDRSNMRVVNFPPTASTIYGVAHLLRLLVAVPVLLEAVPRDDPYRRRCHNDLGEAAAALQRLADYIIAHEEVDMAMAPPPTPPAGTAAPVGELHKLRRGELLECVLCFPEAELEGEHLPEEQIRVIEYDEARGKAGAYRVLYLDGDRKGDIDWEEVAEVYNARLLSRPYS